MCGCEARMSMISQCLRGSEFPARSTRKEHIHPIMNRNLEQQRGMIPDMAMNARSKLSLEVHQSRTGGYEFFSNASSKAEGCAESLQLFVQCTKSTDPTAC